MSTKKKATYGVKRLIIKKIRVENTMIFTKKGILSINE